MTSARAGGHDARIEVVEYDESRPARFAAEAAKPIIDMLALVEDPDAALPRAGRSRRLTVSRGVQKDRFVATQATAPPA